MHIPRLVLLIVAVVTMLAACTASETSKFKPEGISPPIPMAASAELQETVAEAIGANPKPVEEYLEGKEAVMRFLVGQVMRITRGKANPQLASEELSRRLDALKGERV